MVTCFHKVENERQQIPKTVRCIYEIVALDHEIKCHLDDFSAIRQLGLSKLEYWMLGVFR